MVTTAFSQHVLQLPPCCQPTAPVPSPGNCALRRGPGPAAPSSLAGLRSVLPASPLARPSPAAASGPASPSAGSGQWTANAELAGRPARPGVGSQGRGRGCGCKELSPGLEGSARPSLRTSLPKATRAAWEAGSLLSHGLFHHRAGSPPEREGWAQGAAALGPRQSPHQARS